MTALLGCVGTLALVVGASAAMAGQYSLIDADAIGIHRERILVRDWALGAILWMPLKWNDWLLVVAVLAVVALNFFLWTLPISQQQLFYVSLPLGIATFAGLLWLIGRERGKS